VSIVASNRPDPVMPGAPPAWLRRFGVVSIGVAAVTIAMAAWYFHELYKQLLNAELIMMWGQMMGGQLEPGDRLGMNWDVIVPTLMVWGSGIGLSMLVLLAAGGAGVARSAWTRPLHLTAAGLTVAATVGTFVAIAVLVRYAEAVSWTPAFCVAVAVGQSFWAWVSLLVFVPRRRMQTHSAAVG
jgi:hypothetical protein